MNDSDLQQEIEQLKQSRFYKELAALPFNPFEVMDVSKNEILHSKVLEWLLNDYEFSKRLLAWIASKLGKPEWKNINFSEPEVCREYADPEAGRIDVLAHFQSQSINLVVGIEVKINAGERPKQISDYQDLLLKDYADTQEKVIVFLTPEGRPPETADEEHVVRVLEMSWGDIARIIDEMPARLTDKGIFRMQFLQHLKIEFLREAECLVHKLLSQPGNLEIIRKITSDMPLNGSLDNKEEIERIVGKDSVEMVQKIIDNRSSLQTSLECEFWIELKKQLEVKYKEAEFQLYKSGVLEPEAIKDERLEEYIRWRDKGWLGLTFNIPGSFLGDGHEVVCRITYDPEHVSYVFYGFVLCKEDDISNRVEIKDDDENRKKYRDLLERGILEHGPDEDGKHGWLGWNDLKKVHIYFANKPALFNTLVEIKKNREKVAKDLIHEIFGVIKTIYPEQEKDE